MPKEKAVKKLEIGKPFKGNMGDYDKVYKTFSWEDVKKNFDWAKTGKVNIAHEAIDRHVASLGEKIALYSEEPARSARFTFAQLKALSNKLANVLTKLGVKKGDRVFTFLPRIPELYIAAIGVAKTGAILGPLFEAFGPEALRDRLQDSGAKVLISMPEHKTRALDPIRKELPELEKVLIVRAGDYKLKDDEISYESEMASASKKFEPSWGKLEEPVVLHYTSGTTGKPKGVVHANKYMLGVFQTTKWALDLRQDDVYWCTSDPGWVTGTSYGIWGPWMMGVSQVVYAGRFDASTWYSLIKKYKVTVWYSAPTAFRMLMKAGDEVVKKHDLSSLRYVCSVGEPLNPEVIRWGLKAYGHVIHDNWWQTETGHIMIANYPSLKVKFGSMGRPFPGTAAAVIDEKGQELPLKQPGILALKPDWPGMMAEIWKNEPKYKSYFRIPGWYETGDLAYKDEDGYFWFVGRADDIIKTAGERVGPFEVESTLIEHPAVVEAGVIGKPDPVRGQIIKAFIVLSPEHEPSDELKQDITNFVKKHLAFHAYPREIEFIDSLPKTRSGKIMRRVLKCKELGLPIGDISALEEE